MFPNRKQIKRSELLEFILSPHDSEYHKKFIQKEVKKVIEIIDNDIEAIEYDTEDETDTETDYDSDDSDTMIAIKKLYKKSEKSKEIGERIISKSIEYYNNIPMCYPGDDNNQNQNLIYQQ